MVYVLVYQDQIILNLIGARYVKNGMQNQINHDVPVVIKY